jgi:hypothetical protein
MIGNPSHLRPLKRIPVPPAAEKSQDPLGLKPLRLGEKVLESVRCVRVINEDRKPFSFDSLQPSGNPWKFLQRFPEIFGIKTKEVERGKGRRYIFNVVLHRKPASKRDLPSGALKNKFAALKGGGNVSDLVIGLSHKTQTFCLPIFREEAPAVRRVAIDKHSLRLRGPAEKEPFGQKIIFQSLVIIEVLGGKLGENRHFEFEPLDPFLVEGVRRDLERHGPNSLVSHLPQEPKKLFGSRSRVPERPFFRRGLDPKGSDIARRKLLIKKVIEEVGDGGLAIRSRDSNQLELSGGKPVIPVQKRRKRFSRIVHLKPDRLVQKRTWRRFLPHKDPSSPPKRFFNETVAVLLGAGASDEKGPRLGPTGVGNHGQNV